MYDYLKQHAIENAWCSPEQDNQIILNLKRVSKKEGELVSFTNMMRRITLPEKAKRFHIFQVGHAHPTVLGLLPKIPDWSYEGWVSFGKAVENLPLFADIYTSNGVHIPLHRTYYMYTNDRALIVAVDASCGSPIDYSNDDVYVRLYSNAYFESDEASSLTMNTRCVGRTIYTAEDIVAMKTQAEVFAALPGKNFCYVNGLYIESISQATVNIGDVVEIVYDASVKEIYDVLVSDAPSFKSILDDCYKYLLRRPKATENILDYYDDLDIYLIRKDAKGIVGNYYHRNTKFSVRMVTHRDYAIPVNFYVPLAESLAKLLGLQGVDLQSFYIRLIVRHGGLARPLIYDHQRVFELYKLSDANILGAMVGDDSVMPYWTAAALEASAYPKLMRAKYEDINIDLINDAYGYNAITRVIGETPMAVTPLGSTGVVVVPEVLKTNSTMYEYDKDGKLLGFHHHLYGDNYVTTDPKAVIVEGVCGLSQETLLKSTGQDNLPIPTKYTYRVYMCYLVNGVPNNEWKDITGSKYYTIKNGLLAWTGLEKDQWLEIRRDESFLGYTVQVSPVSGSLFFTLAEKQGDDNKLLSIPLGDLDIWADDGSSMIEGLDYIVEFPKVTILNKEFLTQPVETTPQTFTVRFTGFCDSSLKMKEPEDFGFIEYGFLSNNNRFDVRDDRVIRITAGGSYRGRDSLVFSEDHSGVSIVHTLNGKPYQVKDVVVPLRELSDDETYALREKSVIVDNAVEAYMTLKYPQPPRDGPNLISSRWTLMSPFFCRLIADIVSGIIPKVVYNAVLSDTEVMNICAPYEKYLKVDPLNPDLKMDFKYVAVHPTAQKSVVPVSLEAYRFMQKVVTLYGSGQITLNSHLTVNLGGA